MSEQQHDSDQYVPVPIVKKKSESPFPHLRQHHWWRFDRGQHEGVFTTSRPTSGPTFRRCDDDDGPASWYPSLSSSLSTSQGSSSSSGSMDHLLSSSPPSLSSSSSSCETKGVFMNDNVWNNWRRDCGHKFLTQCLYDCSTTSN